MAGGTGYIRTQRSQSGTVGSRTLGSILASGSGGGAGSTRRLYGWYIHNNNSNNFYNSVFGIKYGQFRSRARLFLDNYDY
jgi:hypothetical protein